MKLNEVVGEVLPYDDSSSMKLAKELYRGAGSDVEKAKAMAKGLYQDILNKLDAHDKMSNVRRVPRGREEFRPPNQEVPGYKEPRDRSSFSQFA